MNLQKCPNDYSKKYRRFELFLDISKDNITVIFDNNMCVSSFFVLIVLLYGIDLL